MVNEPSDLVTATNCMKNWKIWSARKPEEVGFGQSTAYSLNMGGGRGAL